MQMAERRNDLRKVEVCVHEFAWSTRPYSHTAACITHDLCAIKVFAAGAMVDMR